MTVVFFCRRLIKEPQRKLQEFHAQEAMLVREFLRTVKKTSKHMFACGLFQLYIDIRTHKHISIAHASFNMFKFPRNKFKIKLPVKWVNYRSICVRCPVGKKGKAAKIFVV